MEAQPIGARFPWTLRLHLKRDFERAFEGGRKTVRSDAILWAVERSDAGPPRMGIVTSRRLGPAVTRNRLKRLIRESFRRGRPSLKTGFDFVVYLRPGRCCWKNLEEANRSLLGLWKKAGLLVDTSAHRR